MAQPWGRIGPVATLLSPENSRRNDSSWASASLRPSSANRALLWATYSGSGSGVGVTGT